MRNLTERYEKKDVYFPDMYYEYGVKLVDKYIKHIYISKSSLYDSPSGCSTLCLYHDYMYVAIGSSSLKILDAGCKTGQLEI